MATRLPDTATTFVLIASDAFKRYQNSTGAFLDQRVGLLRLTAEGFDKLQSLYFIVGNVRVI